jgi:hypothetical protein
MRIEAKVASVIPPSDIAVNVGSEAGVREGDRVVVYYAVNVRDPDSNAELGVIEYTRGTFKVTLVGEKFAAARTTDIVPSAASFLSALTMYGTNAPRAEFKRVVDRSTTKPGFEEGSTNTVVIKVGDLAYVSRREEEEEEEEEKAENSSAEAGGPKQP